MFWAVGQLGPELVQGVDALLLRLAGGRRGDAGLAAGVAVHAVAVVALLAEVDAAVAADLGQAAFRAAVAARRVRVVALLAGVHVAVAALDEAAASQPSSSTVLPSSQVSPAPGVCRTRRWCRGDSRRRIALPSSHCSSPSAPFPPRSHCPSRHVLDAVAAEVVAAADGRRPDLAAAAAALHPGHEVAVEGGRRVGDGVGGHPRGRAALVHPDLVADVVLASVVLDPRDGGARRPARDPGGPVVEGVVGELQRGDAVVDEDLAFGDAVGVAGPGHVASRHLGLGVVVGVVRQRRHGARRRRRRSRRRSRRRPPRPRARRPSRARRRRWRTISTGAALPFQYQSAPPGASQAARGVPATSPTRGELSETASSPSCAGVPASVRTNTSSDRRSRVSVQIVWGPADADLADARHGGVDGGGAAAARGARSSS